MSPLLPSPLLLGHTGVDLAFACIYTTAIPRAGMAFSCWKALERQAIAKDRSGGRDP